MKAIQRRRRGSNELGGIIAIIVVVAIGGYYYYQKSLAAVQRPPTLPQNDVLQKMAEAQKRQQQQFQESLQDKSEPAPAADAARFVGKKARVSNPSYFTPFGGVPAFGRWKDAAANAFDDLANALPSTSVQPTSFAVDLLANRGNVALTGVVFLPVNSEFEVTDARMAKPQFGQAQLICKVRTLTIPSKEYFIHSHALSPVP